MRRQYMGRTKKITLTLLGLILTSGSLIGCGGPRFIDYAHNGSVTLNLDYVGHTFLEDGIQEVTLKQHIDGDTDHFWLDDGQTEILKSRYYGIDTPESTGNIEPWGKKASAFTKEHIMNAAKNGTIVVSSPSSIYEPPQTDSTGSRYLSLVWINETVKHAPKEELTLLNLYIVQEGWSWAKNVSAIPEYADIFVDAMNQAEKFVLGMWQGDDPDYNYGDYQTTSLLDIKSEIVEYLNDQTHENSFDNAKVRFTGTVSGYANNTLYVQERYEIEDEETGEITDVQYAGINIFTGMSVINSRYTEIGTYVEVIGSAQDSENFGFQITDTQGKWSATSQPGDPYYCSVLLTAEENVGVHELYTFNLSSSEQNAMLANKEYDNLFCRTKITDQLYCRYAYVSESGDVTLYFTDCDFNVYIPFQYYGDLDNTSDIWDTADRFVGKSFNLEGTFCYRITSTGKIQYQIVPSSSNDITVVENPHGTLPNDRLTATEISTIASGLNGSSNEKTAMTYFFTGIIDELDAENSSVENLYATMTIKDGSSSVKLFKLAIPSKFVENYYNSETKTWNIPSGMTIWGKGLIQNYGGTYEVVSGSITDTYEHGMLVTDPLSVLEAYNFISSLADADNKHPTVRYYVEGKIASIDVELANNKISLTLTNDTQNIAVIEARLRKTIDASALVAGATIIVSGRPYYNEGAIQLSGSCNIEDLVS